MRSQRTQINVSRSLTDLQNAHVIGTGVRPTPGKAGVFENNSTSDPTAIGVAVADLPDGPFKRVANNPCW